MKTENSNCQGGKPLADLLEPESATISILFTVDHHPGEENANAEAPDLLTVLMQDNYKECDNFLRDVAVTPVKTPVM